MVHAQEARIRVAGLQPAQVLAAVVGLLFLAYGVIGFARTGFADFTGHHVAGFWRFSANPLNNLVHVVTGLVGLVFAFGAARARTFGWLLFLGYGLLFVWGLMLTGLVSIQPFANAGNPLDLGTADTWLHLGIAVLGLVIAMVAARRVVTLPDVDEPADSAGYTDTTGYSTYGGADFPDDDSTRIMPPASPQQSAQEKRGPGLAH